MGAGFCPAILLAHDAKGWTFSVKEMARRLAYHGFATLVPNLHFAADQCTAEKTAKAIAAKGGPNPDVMLGYLKAALFA